MAFNLAGLTKYVDQISGKLIRQVLLEGVTAKIVTVQPTVKYAESINLLANTLYMQSGICGWNASGTTTLTQRNITVSPTMVNQNFCLYGENSLEQYWTGQFMKPGSGANGGTLPFEEVFTKYLADQIEQYNEILIWRGNYSGYSSDSGATAVLSASASAGVLGFLNIIDAASASTVNITYSGCPTTANVGNIVDAIVAALPTNILAQENIVIFTSPAIVQQYKLWIRNQNAYNYFVQDAGTVNTLTQKVPGFGNVTVIGTVGLAGTCRMIASYASNFYIGTDLMDELNGSMFNLFYAMEAQELRFVYRGKVGTQVAFPEYVVRY